MMLVHGRGRNLRRGLLSFGLPETTQALLLAKSRAVTGVRRAVWLHRSPGGQVCHLASSRFIEGIDEAEKNR